MLYTMVALCLTGLMPSALSGCSIPCQILTDRSQAPTAKRLEMTPGVVCRVVKGYRDYEARPAARLTADEKLIVYYEPTGFATTQAGHQHRAHLIQDAMVREAGKKSARWKKAKIVEYEGRSQRAEMLIYLMNTIAIKDLGPGAYELVITLKDQISGETAEQVVEFQVIRPE
jgi:hypothetical protein